MTQTTWDPSDTGGWTLSNGDLTATSPDNNTKQSVFVAFADFPIPDDAKTYFEYRGIRRRGSVRPSPWVLACTASIPAP